MTEQSAAPIKRSDRFIASYQLSGLCDSLRLTLQCDAPHDQYGKSLLKKLQEDVIAIVDGRAVKNLPELDRAPTTAYLLLYAEILRMTLFVACPQFMYQFL